jgi:DinB superfamily
MNAHDVLHYAHADVLKTFDGVRDADWTKVGVTREWSMLDVLAHLTSYELFLEDALKSVLGRTPTPTLDAMGRDRAGFNTAQVAARRGRTPQQVMDEYTQAHTRVMTMIEELGPERLRAVGTIPWYGAPYSLDDFIVYAIYGHEREHCGQVRQFKLRIAAQPL